MLNQSDLLFNSWHSCSYFSCCQMLPLGFDTVSQRIWLPFEVHWSPSSDERKFHGKLYLRYLKEETRQHWQNLRQLFFNSFISPFETIDVFVTCVEPCGYHPSKCLDWGGWRAVSMLCILSRNGWPLERASSLFSITKRRKDFYFPTTMKKP